MKSQPLENWIPLAGALGIWIPAMVAASYEWGHGEYYDYGWFVAPAALGLAILRWRSLDGPVRLPGRKGVILGFLVLIPWLLLLRVLGYVDPSWRLPTTLLGLTALVTGHALIGASRGIKASRSFLWISLLCLSAMPWPTAWEIRLVHGLTQSVISTVVEVFQLLGRPVFAMGDRLQLHDLTVEVTDGCSGIRSFQSFVMATWFFAEWQKLKAWPALVLLACSCVVAYAINVSRTYTLAWIRFDHGLEAFHRAHDWLGILAFAFSALVFYVLSGKLGRGPARRLVKSHQTRI